MLIGLSCRLGVCADSAALYPSGSSATRGKLLHLNSSARGSEGSKLLLRLAASRDIDSATTDYGKGKGVGEST